MARRRKAEPPPAISFEVRCTCGSTIRALANTGTAQKALAAWTRAHRDHARPEVVRRVKREAA